MQEIAVSNVTAWDVELYTSMGNDPQRVATSHTYSISWNGVQYNDLSVGRLLMLISIARAEASEAILQNEMELLARQSALLESSVQAMELLLAGNVGYSTSFSYADETGTHQTTLGSYLQNVLKINGNVPNSTWGEAQITELFSNVKNRQDELNTVTQKTTINIKDLVTKRNQAHLMDTNALKRLLNDAQSTANNI
jgi:hypothetical protein